MRVPAPLHFAKGTDFKNGTTAGDDGGDLPDSVLKRKLRRVEFETPPNGGSETLALIAKKGALLSKGEVALPPTFKVALTDVNGDVTKLQVPGTPG
jgi:hypothetical protein